MKHFSKKSKLTATLDFFVFQNFFMQSTRASNCIALAFAVLNVIKAEN